jgi:hypothetical protein
MTALRGRRQGKQAIPFVSGRLPSAVAGSSNDRLAVTADD